MSKFLDGTGLSSVLTKIKAAFISVDDTEAVTPVNAVSLEAVAVDNTPTENSTNLVTSGGVYAAIEPLAGKEDYISKESFQNFCQTLISAGIIGGFSMTYNSTTQEYNFTITPPTNG